jgi:hypothetical protein
MITIDMQDVDPATRMFACAESGAFNESSVMSTTATMGFTFKRGSEKMMMQMKKAVMGTMGT